jgi:hypothetical protein
LPSTVPPATSLMSLNNGCSSSLAAACERKLRAQRDEATARADGLLQQLFFFWVTRGGGLPQAGHTQLYGEPDCRGPEAKPHPRDTQLFCQHHINLEAAIGEAPFCGTPLPNPQQFGFARYCSAWSGRVLHSFCEVDNP